MPECSQEATQPQQPGGRAQVFQNNPSSNDLRVGPRLPRTNQCRPPSRFPTKRQCSHCLSLALTSPRSLAEKRVTAELHVENWFFAAPPQDRVLTDSNASWGAFTCCFLRRWVRLEIVARKGARNNQNRLLKTRFSRWKIEHWFGRIQLCTRQASAERSRTPKASGKRTFSTASRNTHAGHTHLQT